MNDLDLSLVIICCDDYHVYDTLASVDIKIPVIVSLVPNPKLELGIRSLGANIVFSQRGNYSVSCNFGLAAVQTKSAFIVDSDCKLKPGCLEIIANTLKTKPLARDRVQFESTNRVKFSELTSELHSETNNGLPIRAYTPGLGLRLDIIDHIGGYFFDERIFWSGDSEFSHRVKRAGLQVVLASNAVILHGPINIPHTINSGYKLGMGTCAQVKFGLRPPYESPRWIINRLLQRKPSKIERSNHNSRGVNLLRFLWTLAFYAGYYRAWLRNAHEIGKE